MMQPPTRLAAALLAGLLASAVAAPVHAQSDPNESSPQAPGLGGTREPATEIPGIAYKVALLGDLDEELRDKLDAVSRLIQEAERRPLTEAALRRRVRDDVTRLLDALRALGYFAATIEPEIVSAQQVTQVNLKIDTGGGFRLSAYDLTYDPVSPVGKVPRTAADLDLEIGMTAASEPLARAEGTLLRKLGQVGYPKARIAEKKYIADHGAKTLSARLVVDTGPRVTFGPLAIEGLKGVEEDYVRRLAAWPEGEVYDQRKIEAMRQRLAQSNLFQSAVIEPAETPGPDAALPADLRLVESKQRSIGAGASYTSGDIGFGGELFWEHRNLLGEGERLRLQGTANKLRQEAAALGRKPNYLRLDQSLLANSAVAHENSDAFEERSWTNFVGLERKLSKALTVSAGPAFEFSRIDDNRGEEKFRLLGIVGSVGFDNRDDILNPTKGFNLSANSQPWLGTLGKQTTFWSNDLNAATYYAPFGNDSAVFAVRGRYGFLVGVTTNDVPANKRFYAGGGGSVRGYEFRSVGPLDADDDPIGGRSVAEIALEMRLRPVGDVGLVPFINGGQVYDNAYPSLGEDFLWGAGLGLRYFTPVGPLRLDVAVPLNPRDDVDDPYQFYISIGQAF